MIFEPKYFKQSLEFILSNNYERNYKGLLSLLRRSRWKLLKKNGLFLYVLQLGIIDAVVEMQDAITKLNKEKTEAIKNGDDTDKIDRALRNNKEILRVIYTIADGVVARLFKFDRPILRVMSENKQLGHLKKDTFDHVGLIKSLLLQLRGRGICIANDITRYLRIGDMTTIDSDGKVVIYEAKTNTKTGKSKLIDAGQIFTNIIESKNFPNSQNQRHLVAQMVVITRRISVPEEVTTMEQPYKEKVGVDIVDLPVIIKHHLKEVGHALKVSKKNIVSHLELEDGYSISILRCDQLTPENTKSSLDTFDNSAPDWFERKNEYMFHISNLQSFVSEDNEFARNILPYSVFPFDTEDCLKLMTGEIYICVYLDLRKLKEKLEVSGWTVEDGNLIEILRSKKPYEKEKRDNSNMFGAKDPVVFALSKETEYGTYWCSILGTQILPAMFSFYSLDFLVDVVSQQFAISEPGKGRFVTHNYLDE